MDEVYYKQSGKFTAGNLLGTFLFCVIVSVIFAFIYSLINRYNPFAYVQVIATVIFAILLGIMNAQVLEIGKVRNISINVIYGLIMSLIALYFSWTFWLFEIFNYKYELLRIVTSPLIDWQVITDISKVGTKTFRGTELKGTTLWGVEAVK
jgi:carbon starvation protein CstA